MAVDSMVPDVPALRIIPASRLLSGDELWGVQAAGQWRLYAWAVRVELTVIRNAGLTDIVTVTGRQDGAPFRDAIDTTKHVLITFRTNAFAMKEDGEHD